MTDIKKYLPKVRDVLQKQLDDIGKIELPIIKEITNFHINDEILKGKSKDIRINYDLPLDRNQIIYVMYLEGFTQDRSNFQKIIDEIRTVKSKFSHELSQVTSINENNFKFHLDHYSPIVPMYVGTSKAFASRVKTHAGFGSKGTATVCLKGWPELQVMNIKFKFKYFDFGKDIAPETLKFFEYYLSHDLKPLIGHNRRS